MPEVQEVFRMSTQKVRQDPGAMERQLNRRRKAARNRKLGSFAVVGVIVAAAIVAAVVAREESRKPASSPTAEPGRAGQALSIVDIGTGEATALTVPISTSGFDTTLDGSMVTYTGFDGNGNDQVFVMDVDGSNQRQLTHTPGGVTLAETPPQWSPDGSTIAYWATPPAGVTQLFVVRLADGVSTSATHEPKDVAEGGWASDRSFVFSISNPTSAYPLLAKSIDLDKGETTTIARDVSTPEVSPDGTQIAFDSYFRPQGEAWLSLMNIDGTDRRKIQRVDYSSGSFPKWSPDSMRVAFFDTTAKSGSGTYVYDLATGEKRFVTAGTIESWIDNDHMLVS
jgi:Tol biopolymer transport system component